VVIIVVALKNSSLYSSLVCKVSNNVLVLVLNVAASDLKSKVSVSRKFWKVSVLSRTSSQKS